MQSRLNAPKHPNTSQVFEFSSTHGLLCNDKFPSEALAEPERKPGLILSFSTRECLYSQLLGTTNTNVLGYTTSPSTAAFCPNCTSFQIQTEQSKSNNCLYGCRPIQHQKNKDRETNKQERKIMFLPGYNFWVVAWYCYCIFHIAKVLRTNVKHIYQTQIGWLIYTKNRSRLLLGVLSWSRLLPPLIVWESVSGILGRQ